MNVRHPRCIVLVGQHRCHRRAAARMGDLYACCSHGVLTVAIMSDRLSPYMRRLLAYARWETQVEGQELIDRLRRRAVA